MLGNVRRRAVLGGERRRPLGSMPWRAAFQASTRTTPSSAGPGGTHAAGVVAEDGDAGRARVDALGVGADDAPAALVLAGGRFAGPVDPGPAAFVDAALLVDEEVVPDVVPAVVAGVVGVDRPHGLGRVGVVVRASPCGGRRASRSGRTRAAPCACPRRPPSPARVMISGCGGPDGWPPGTAAGPEPGVDDDDLDRGAGRPAHAETGRPRCGPHQAGGDEAGVVVAGVVPDRQPAPGAPPPRRPPADLDRVGFAAPPPEPDVGGGEREPQRAELDRPPGRDGLPAP